MEDNAGNGKQPRRNKYHRLCYELKVQRDKLAMQKEELAESRRRLGQSEARYERLYQFAPVGYVTLDRQGMIRQKNFMASEMLLAHSASPKPFVAYIEQEDHGTFFGHLATAFAQSELRVCEVRLRAGNGQAHYVRLYSMRLSAEENQCLTAIIDITENKQHQEIISHMAYYDSLTGMPNRSLFIDRLSQAIKESLRRGSRLAVVFIDLDNFKRINDTQGHAAGDQMLRIISKRIQHVLRDIDTLARLGGDEFTVLLNDIAGGLEVVDITQRILRTIEQPCEVDGMINQLSASVGVAIYPKDGMTAEELLKAADTAMYKAKEKGKNTCSFYDDDMRQDIVRKVSMERLLREALGKNEISIQYQPQVNAADGIPRGLEALMRWNSDALGRVPPGEFIPIAEEGPVIMQLGEWILYQACQQNQEWRKKGMPEMIIAVNVSAVQLKDKGFAAKVADVLSQTALQPRFLEVEFAESLLFECSEIVLNNLRSLKELGVGISLDDFGNGYSSLRYLSVLPIDILKIDRSFIQNLHCPKTFSMIRAIVSLAHELGLKVAAEGVETFEQASVLKEAGCDIFQGYYFCQPAEARNIEKMIRRI